MDGRRSAGAYIQEKNLENAMLFLLALLCASAQEVTAQALLPPLKLGTTAERVAIDR